MGPSDVERDSPDSGDETKGHELSTGLTVSWSVIIALGLLATGVSFVIAGDSIVTRFSGRDAAQSAASTGVEVQELVERTVKASACLLVAVLVSHAVRTDGEPKDLVPRKHGFRPYAAALLAWSLYGLSMFLLPDPTRVAGPASTDRSFLEGVVLSVTAGISEEVVAAFVIGASVVVAGWASRFWKHGWLIIAAAIVLASVARGAGHLYQSDRNALAQVILGVALGMLFLWCRSVWPAIIAHIIYDLVVILAPSDAVPVVLTLFVIGSYLLAFPPASLQRSGASQGSRDTVNTCLCG